MRDRRPPPRMARDLIGPALPPGFKALGTADDKERDPSPGKLRASPHLPQAAFSRPASLSQAGEDGEWAVGAGSPSSPSLPSRAVGRRPQKRGLTVVVRMRRAR